MTIHAKSGASAAAVVQGILDTARAKSVGRPPVRSASMEAHRAAADRALAVAFEGDKDECTAIMIGVSRTQVRKWLHKDPEPETAPLAMVMGLDPEKRAKVYAAIEAECAKRTR